MAIETDVLVKWWIIMKKETKENPKTKLKLKLNTWKRTLANFKTWGNQRP